MSVQRPIRFVMLVRFSMYFTGSPGRAEEEPRQTDRDRQTDRQRERQTDRDRDRDRDRETECIGSNE